MSNSNGLATLIRTVLSIQSLEVVFISDFDTRPRLDFPRDFMNEEGVGMTLVDIRRPEQWDHVFLTPECHSEEVFDEYFKLFVFWMSDEVVPFTLVLLQQSTLFVFVHRIWKKTWRYSRRTWFIAKTGFSSKAWM